MSIWASNLICNVKSHLWCAIIQDNKFNTFTILTLQFSMALRMGGKSERLFNGKKLLYRWIWALVQLCILLHVQILL